MIISNNFSSKDMKVILPLLIQDYNDVFSNIIKLIQIAYCIPFSNVECERDFSRQNKIKTKDRNLLVTNTLNMLMRVFLEGPESKNLTIYVHIQFGVIKKGVLALNDCIVIKSLKLLK